MGINKSKQSQSSTSSNQAYPFLQGALGDQVGNVGASSSALSALLGGDASGLQGFQNATGFDAQAEQGSRGITGNAAAGGLLRAGSTAKGLQSYGQNLQNQSAQSYIQNLLGLGNLGLGSAGVLAGAGQTSSSTGKGSSKGLQFPGASIVGG